MKAIVLVGGEGTRLRPLTYTTPKPLLPVANIAFLDRQLTWLSTHGVDEVVLSLGYLPDAFQDHFPGDRFGSIALSYAVEERPLGTAGGIRFAAQDCDERIVVCNGDILTDLDLGEVVRFHDESAAEATISLTRVPDPSAFGVVPTRDDGSVIAFVEKPPPGMAPSDWINAGTYVLEPSVLARIPPRLPVSIERETFPRMLEQGGRLFAVKSDAYWLDIGSPDKYLQAHGDVLAGRLGGPEATGARRLDTRVWATGTHTLAEQATVVAPALMGDGVVIDDGATVRASTLGDGAVVRSGAVIERAVLHAGAVIEADAKVSDSVIGHGATIGAGAVVADMSIIGAGVVVAPGSHHADERASVPPGSRST